MLARKKQEARQSASEEARKQALWEERKRAREEEEKAAASGVKPKSTQEKLLDPVSVAVSESKWDRLMNGGGKKKKTKRAPAAAEAAGQGGGGGSEHKKPGEEGVSVRAASAHQLLLVTRAAQVACSAPKPPLPSPLRVPGGRDQPDASRAGHGTASIAERLAAPRLLCTCRRGEMAVPGSLPEPAPNSRVRVILLCRFVTAAVWCAPFCGAVALFNKLVRKPGVKL